jgi:hypothetical protein
MPVTIEKIKPETTRKIVKSSVGAAAAILLFLCAGLRLPVLDNTSDAYFREAIAKAGLAYATCRVINASVSIVKESSLNLEPAGIGVTFAVGQAVDPIDDMTERVSDVIVAAIASLGVEKLVCEIDTSLAPPLLAMLLFMSSALIWFKNKRIVAVQRTVTRFILLILIARFALPISAMANNYLQDHFFREKISNANKELAIGSAELEKLTKFSLPEMDGVVGTLKNSSSFLKRKSLEFKNALVSVVNNAGHIIENLLTLIFLFVGVFLIQVIALPILVFWLLLKFANSLFHTPLSLRPDDSK